TIGKVRGWWSILWDRSGASASQALAGEIDAMGVVNKAVEDRVGISRIANERMPFIDGDLAGEDRRAAPIALLEGLVEVTTCAGVERVEAPVVEGEELDAGKAAQDAGIAAVAAGERELGEEFGDALVENRAVITTSFVTKRTGKPTFADPSGPAQDQIVVGIDPLAIGEFVKQRAVEAARGSVIDVLDGGLLAQSGITQSRGQPLVTAMRQLTIEQQAEPVGMAEIGSFAGGLEFGKGLSHSRKPELAQL